MLERPPDVPCPPFGFQGLLGRTPRVPRRLRGAYERPSTKPASIHIPPAGAPALLTRALEPDAHPGLGPLPGLPSLQTRGWGAGAGGVGAVALQGVAYSDTRVHREMISSAS